MWPLGTVTREFRASCREPPVDLFSALDIRRGERIALVGGGGKTGLACRLVAEAQRRGWTALFTTTTKVLAGQGDEEGWVVLGEGEPDLAGLRQRLLQRGRLFLARQWLAEWEDTPAGRQQKVGGFAAAAVDEMAAALQPDLLVVEADGSRHRPFKAPADHEPVIPPGTTLVGVLAGLSVLGRPLEAAWVHRPERVAELAGVSPGVAVQAAVVATVLAHPHGGRQGVPPAARAVAVLTQATAERLPAGREVARRLLWAGGLERVVLVELEASAGPAEVWRGGAGDTRVSADALSVPAVVLAAGCSRRMGRNKLLLPLGDKPLLAHAVDAALGSPADTVWVVLGDEAAAVRQALGTRPVNFLLNPRWAEGQSTSVREAVAALQERSAGILFLAGDVPSIPPDHLGRLIERFRAGATVVWSGDGPYRGIPALFGREALADLLRLEGDVGGRVLAGRFPEAVVPVSFPLLDVDTPAEYEQARRWLENRGP